MDEIKTTRTLVLKPTVYLIDEDNNTIDSSITKVATLKIQDYSMAASEMTFEQAQQSIFQLTESVSSTEPVGVAGFGNFYYIDSASNKYAFKPLMDYGALNPEIGAELINTTETTLTDIGWNE